MRTLDKRVVGTLLAATVGLTSATVFSNPAGAAPPIRIHGVVTAAGGTGLSGIHVTALGERTVDGVAQWVEIDTATTGADGSYNVGKLPDGSYKVRYDDPSGSYSTEFYNDAFRPADATVVELRSGKFDMAPVVLGGAAHLSGLVTGSTGAGIVGAEVTAYVEEGGAWNPLTTIETVENGRWDLGLLPGGAYKLGFHDPATGVGEYWNDNASLADADTLTVQNAGSTSGLDATLATPLPTPDPTPVPSPEPTTEPSTEPSPTPTADPTSSTTAPATPAAPAPVATTPATTTTAKVVMVKRPRIRGLAKVTQVVRVTRGTWNPTTVSRKIQWLANGKRIKGATKARLRVTAKLAGKRLSVRVVASAPQRTPLVVTTRTTRSVRR
ncbi:hypothetical protein ACFQW6_03300 [Nocardioides sp. GCM10028917]|uniref:hypothetical protein n=1 Tax=Nocardioides sp. GCM10028917 TaxID=3273408 RepID=UPI00360A9AB2